MSTTSETPREEAWQAHLRSKHNHRQARRSSFDAGFEAGMRVILAAGPRAVAAAAWDEGYGDDLTCREPRENPYREDQE